MNSSAKTLFCRAAFVVLVALPTFATLSYVACGIWRPIEMTPAAWSSLLSEKTGLEIRIAKMQRDGTGIFILEQFEVCDPESSNVWITSPRAEVTVDGAKLRLELHEMAIAASAVAQLSEHLQHRVLKSRKEGFQPFTLHAASGKLLLSGSEQTALPIANLEVVTRMDESGPIVDADVELTDEGTPVWVRLEAKRRRADNAASTHYEWKIDGDAGISTKVLAEFAPDWGALGPYARFWGWGESEGSNYTLSGIEFRDIDLAELGAYWGIQGVSGVASIGGKGGGDALPGARVEFRDGEFTDLFGEIRAESGTLDSRLLSRLARALPLEVDVGVDNQTQVDFTSCGVRVELRGENLKISSLVKSGDVLENRAQPVAWLRSSVLRNARDITGALLSEVHSDALPVSQWVASMPPPRNAQVPSAASARKNTKSR